jgi:2-dehydropantoate 2-reductase
LTNASAGRVLVVGTGALACALGAKLARAGTDVTLAGSWQAALAAIGSRGVLVHEQGVSWSAAVRAVPIDARFDPFRMALVLVKSRQTARVAETLRSALTGDGIALTLQNGLGNREQLETLLGSERVAAGVALLGATSNGPGEVRFIPGRLVVESGVRVEELSALLRAADLPVDEMPCFASVVWAKLAANCAINALTAIHGVDNGALLERADWRYELCAAAREVGVVAAAKGIELGRDAVEIALEVAHATAGNRSSMLQDASRGAPTEIDALNGAVVHEGRRLGVATPVNERLWREIRCRQDAGTAGAVPRLAGVPSRPT